VATQTSIVQPQEDERSSLDKAAKPNTDLKRERQSKTQNEIQSETQIVLAQESLANTAAANLDPTLAVGRHTQEPTAPVVVQVERALKDAASEERSCAVPKETAVVATDKASLEWAPPEVRLVEEQQDVLKVQGEKTMVLASKVAEEEEEEEAMVAVPVSPDASRLAQMLVEFGLEEEADVLAECGIKKVRDWVCLGGGCDAHAFLGACGVYARTHALTRTCTHLFR
jgi:hypothetical protein